MKAGRPEKRREMNQNGQSDQQEAHPNRLLIVDDDRGIVDLLTMQLRSGGYEIACAFGGEEALEHIVRHAPDLILLDIAMPGVSGLDILTYVREHGLSIAVIMMTAFGSQDVAVDALRRGADNYLIKPFGLDEIRLMVARALDRLALERRSAALSRRLARELTQAAQIQRDLLPGETISIPGFELQARCISAREVGGDFYDWQYDSPNTLNLVLGDVMGKGMPAALLMTTIRATLRAVSHAHRPAEALDLAGQILKNDLLHSGMFTTVFCAQLDVESRRLRFVDAGHGHALVWRADGSTERLQPRCFPLGVDLDEPYREGAIEFSPGDYLIVYSDGLVDSRPAAEAASPPLLPLLRGSASAAEAVDRLIQWATPNHELSDDLTVLVLHCQERVESHAGEAVAAAHDASMLPTV